MKRIAMWCITAMTALMPLGCGKDRYGKGNGELRLKFPEFQAPTAKAALELPDTNDFILEVKGPDGAVVYSGAYGLSPEVMEVPAGSYSITVQSSAFPVPAFDKPVFGDEQVVLVPSGGTVCATMDCRQTNAGVRLKISPDFLTVYPQGTLSLKSDKGKLNYNYRETRYACFMPGKISLVMTEGSEETILMTRTLQEAEMLTVNVNVSGRESQEKNGISVKIDTVRQWFTEDFTIGGGESGGSGEETAMSVAQAKENIGAKNVWVTGYIVGGDMTTGEEGISFCAPFGKASHLAIASRGSVSSKSSCMAVELPSGNIRDELNLVSHPDLIGRRVSLKGNIEVKYLGITGLKGVSDFVLH